MTIAERDWGPGRDNLKYFYEEDFSVDSMFPEQR